MAKYRHFSKNGEIFGHDFKVYFVFGKIANPLCDNLYAFGPIFIVLNGQILQNHFGHMVTLVVDKIIPTHFGLDHRKYVWANNERRAGALA